MHVIHAVHGTECVTWSKACAAPDTHARKFSIVSFHLNKPWVVERLRVLVASHVNVNVRDHTDAQSF